MEVTSHEFIKKICSDFSIDFYQKIKKYYNEFPLINGVKKINLFNDSIIVDKNGNEHPYMLGKYLRNEEKLKDFDYIYIIRPKAFNQIIEETGLFLKSEKCKISEGGGWYSQGTRFFYKDIYCELNN